MNVCVCLFSLRLNGHFPGETGSAGFIETNCDGSGGDNWSRKSCSSQIVTTNTQLFPGWMPVRSPNQQRRSTVRMRPCANVAGNTYSIENLRNDEAKLFFTQIKG